ncbi:hypothetical protein SprV_0902750400 [Sparganum proliferum]
MWLRGPLFEVVHGEQIVDSSRGGMRWGLYAPTIERMALGPVGDADPGAPLRQVSISTAENMRLKRVGASTQPCFIPFVTESCSEKVLSSVTRIIIQSWRWRTMWLLAVWAPAGSQSVPRSDEAVIHPVVGVANRHGHQQVLSIGLLDENLVQQLSTRAHPDRLLPHWKAEGVGEYVVFYVGQQEKQTTVFVTADYMWTQHSSPSTVVCPDAGVEATKDD